MADHRAGPARTTPALVQQLARANAARLAAAFAEQGLDGLGQGHAVLLVPLLGGGRHASSLAASLGVSRQAVAQAVTALEGGGYVQRVADPGDARAKLICLTARGRAALRVMRTSALAAERDWEARLGQRRLAEFRDTLTALLNTELPGVSGEEPPDDRGRIEGRGWRIKVQ